MSAIPIEPRAAAKLPDCAWCGLRIAAEVHQGTWSCRECIDGGRMFRLRMSNERWKRAKGT